MSLHKAFPALFGILDFRSSQTPDYHKLIGKEDHIVFVYGTLKRRHKRHSVLKDSKYLGPACTAFHHYEMMDSGLHYPVVFEGAKPDRCGRVDGEAYAVPTETLVKLDNIEGNPFFFKRKPVSIVLKKQILAATDKGVVIQAHTYLGQHRVEGYTIHPRAYNTGPDDKPIWTYKWYPFSERES